MQIVTNVINKKKEKKKNRSLSVYLGGRSIEGHVLLHDTRKIVYKDILFN
jgi:hypothetical protein